MAASGHVPVPDAPACGDPRVQCPTHGVKQVRVPWAEARSRFTLLMERLVIDLILQCSTVKGACAIAGVSWDEAWGIMQRAVARGQRAERGASDHLHWRGREGVSQGPPLPHGRL